MEESNEKAIDFINQIKKKIANKKEYELVEQGSIVRHNRIYHIDAILAINNYSFVLFEFKNNLSTLNRQDVVNIYEKTNLDCRYFVLSDGIYSKVYDTYFGNVESAKDFNEFWKILFVEYSETHIHELKISIVEEIKKEIYTFRRNLNGNFSKSKNNEILTKINNLHNAINLFEKEFEENLKFDTESRSFFITEDLRTFSELENRFFKTIIEDVTIGTEIYRYTTLDSVFRTIEGKTLRLSGIVGMNDISEIGYVDGYLDKKFKPMGTDDQVNSINKKYLMCSSTLEDDLMQWRLYGDDCKGACMVFEVNGGNDIPGLLLRKINYGIKLNGENYHPELEFLMQIKNRLRKKLKVDFKFKTLSLWRHFFKSYEYEPEKEVRLLLIGNESDEIKGEKFSTGSGTALDIKWNLTNSHQILAPFIILNIDDARLKCNLKQIILGSKCPELEINIKQFSLLARKKNLSRVKIIPSKIINYR